MFHRLVYPLLALAVGSMAALASPSVSQAKSAGAPTYAISPLDLINAVNALRSSNGLPQYSINSILMYTAQNQADFMAAIGTVTHSGPGGIGLTDRLLAAGYPLAGDLSAGGFRAENVSSGNENTSAETVVNGWTGDAPHLNTMLSPNLTEIGAGVTVSGGRLYFVIDCALPTTGGAPQAAASVVGDGATVPAGGALIPVVVVSTPNADGNVIHDVLAGQTLWQIAIAYDVKIDDIKRFNNLFVDDIYPGNKLLIRQGEMAPTASPEASPTPEAAASPTIAVSFTVPVMQPSVTSSSTLVSSNRTVGSNSVMGFAIGIIALAILGGGLFTWLGTAKRE